MRTSTLAQSDPCNPIIRIPRPSLSAQRAHHDETPVEQDEQACDRALPNWQAVALEQEIIAVLDAPAFGGETVALAFARKERELTLTLSRLNAIDSLALRRRLELLLPGDPIAERFRRLVADRRSRLLAFLADARRRIAIESLRTQGSLHRS